MYSKPSGYHIVISKIWSRDPVSTRAIQHVHCKVLGNTVNTKELQDLSENSPRRDEHAIDRGLYRCTQGVELPTWSDNI